jgi:hypothetical protein
MPYFTLMGVCCDELQKAYIKEETLKRLEVDEEVLGDFFREIITPAVSWAIYYP